MNPHLQYLNDLNQAAQTFWQAWQTQLPQLQMLSTRDFVERSNDILHQSLPDVMLELEGDMHNAISTIVFTADGVRDYFPDVQAVVQAAPKNLSYKICAFRQPNAGIGTNFMVGMNGFELGINDIMVRLDTWREMPALEIAFTKAISEDFLSHAQNMTFIILDHFIGEYNSSVKIDAVDFLDEAEADFFPLIELPEKLDALWHELGRTGIYPQPEWEYAIAEAEENDEQDGLLLTRNQSANSLLGRADMAWIVSISAQLNDAHHLQAAYDLEDEFVAYAAQHQQGLTTIVVMNLSQGVRTVYAATCTPETLLPQALSLCERFKPLNPEVVCEYDPTWIHYRF